ncbi:GFA family protein [Hansschlegelia beijingensis]
MAAGERVQGECLCGAVTMAATLKDGSMHACHCSMCRRWSAGPFLYLAVEPASLQIAGGEAVGRYRSSAEAERGFCRICGSTMFWRALDGSSLDVSAQSVDDPARFPFATEVFMDDKPGNYAFADATRKFSGDEGSARTAEARNG